MTDAWGGNTTPTEELFQMASRNLTRNALYIGKNAGEEGARLQRYSLRTQLVQEVVAAASAYALSAGHDVHEFEDLASNGISIINGLQWGLTGDKRVDWGESEKRDLNWNFWRHADNPAESIKRRQFPYMSRDEIESQAYAYLELPYRVPGLERLLIDILIALELYAYTKEMLQKPIPGLAWANRSPLMQKHVLRKYIFAQFWGGLCLLGLAFLASNYGRNVVGPTAAGWISGTLVGLFLLDLVVSTALLPFAWRAQRKEKEQVRRLIKHMLETYHELRGEGQLSTRRLREVATRAADAGTVWPKPLFLILDDNERRVSRI